MNRYFIDPLGKNREGFTIYWAPLLWIALSAICTCSAFCQQPTPTPRPTPPPGPLLNPAPNFSAWTITYSYPQERKQETGHSKPAPLDPNAPRKVVTIKTGHIIHEETINVGGAHFDLWQVDRTVYTKPHGQAYWGESGDNKMQDTRGDQSIDMALPVSGFRDLDWVNEGSYAASLNVNNVVYLLFAAPGAADLDIHSPSSLAAQTLLAYVDDTTRLPVVFRINGVIRSYSFSPPPTSMQALPADLAKEIQEGNEKRAKLFPAPAREY